MTTTCALELVYEILCLVPLAIGNYAMVYLSTIRVYHILPTKCQIGCFRQCRILTTLLGENNSSLVKNM